jgi:carbonic anhydrase
MSPVSRSTVATCPGARSSADITSSHSIKRQYRWRSPDPGKLTDQQDHTDSPPTIAAVDSFKDLVDGNAEFAEAFSIADLSPIPRRHLAVVTCMDCRVDPLAMFGFETGDIHVMRNAGARITPDIIRSLIKSVNQLEVDRIAIVHHTDCGAAKIDLSGLRAKVLAATGSDPDGVEFHLIGDQASALSADVEAVRSCPYLPVGTAVAGFLYDVTTGLLTPHTSTFVS